MTEWVEPSYQPVLPLQAPAHEMFPERADFAFTSSQRQWYLRVFTNESGLVQCAFQRYTEERGWHRCDTTGEKNIEIHHLHPSGWLQEQEPYTDPNELNLYDENLGIALCKFHHDRTIHPDIGKAFDDYRENTNSFKQAIGKHKELAEQGIVFWNNEWDKILTQTAVEQIMRYTTEHPDDKYPLDKRWARTKHPKQKHWTDYF